MRRRTDSVAPVLREADAAVLAGPYLAAMIIATSRCPAGTGVQLVLVNARDDGEQRTLADYDDVELAALTEPAPTTVPRPVPEQARTTTDLLLRRIEGDEPGAPVLLPVELVVRGSG